MSVNKAQNIFLGRDGYQRKNCAQAVISAFNDKYTLNSDIAETFQHFGGGNAPEGMCGAYYAARYTLVHYYPEMLEDFEKYFIALAGSVKCLQIRKYNKLSCLDCVGISSEYLDKAYQKNTSLEYHDIKDRCRRNLIRYTKEAFSSIPRIDCPLILDLGCGTGESTLALLEASNGYAYAVDSDEKSLAHFKRKAELMNLDDRIRIIQDSVLNSELFCIQFDLIIAEGILNVIGFEKGLEIINNWLKQGGYAIIHDEISSDREKRMLFKSNNMKVLNVFKLDEFVWWNEYFAYIKKSIKSASNKELFHKEIQEIEEYEKSSEKFRSIIYVLAKNNEPIAKQGEF